MTKIDTIIIKIDKIIKIINIMINMNLKANQDLIIKIKTLENPSTTQEKCLMIIKTNNHPFSKNNLTKKLNQTK